MIYYSIESLARAGIFEFLITTTSRHQQAFIDSLTNARFSNLHFTFAIQDSTNGIAESLSIGKEFIGDDDVCLVTGDTIILGEELDAQVIKAIRSARKSANAAIFISNLYDSEQYVVIIYENSGSNIKIGGKAPSYYYSITGFYVFPNRVVNKINTIVPSECRLLEIITLHKLFHNDKKLQNQELNNKCKWFTPNNFKELLDASIYFSKIKNY